MWCAQCRTAAGTAGAPHRDVPRRQGPPPAGLGRDSPGRARARRHGHVVARHRIINGVEHEIGDGGLLNWTQNLLANKKERMLTMGIGIQLLHLFKKQKC